MRVWRLVALMAGLCLAGPVRAQTTPTVDDLFRLYQAGRFADVVAAFERRFRSQADVDEFVRHLRRARAGWPKEATAALALEASAVHWRFIYLYPAEFGRRQEAASDLFELGCAVVRTGVPWEFAVRWHAAAIALLSGPPDERWGISTVSERAYFILREHHGHIDDEIRAHPRVAFAWGISRDLLVQRTVYVSNVVNKRGVEQPAGGGGEMAGWLRAAGDAFQTARTDRALAPEATLRLGMTLAYLGHTDAAIRHWETIPHLTEDSSLRYLALMLRGRIMASASRLEQAEAAFRSALELKPGAQSSLMPLAAVLFATGRQDAAIRMTAERFGAMTPASDPWWTYIDARLSDHLSRLREGGR
jgi:hypothetical protein